MIKIESFDKAEKLLESERKNKELSDSFDALLVEKNTLHDENLNLKRDVRLYSNGFKKLKEAKVTSGGVPDINVNGWNKSEVEASLRMQINDFNLLLIKLKIVVAATKIQK